MAVRITVGLQDAGMLPAVDRMEEASTDLRPLMDDIGILLEGSTKDRLTDTNVSPDGIAWPKSMRAKEDGGKTLVDSRRLVASILNVASERAVEIGSNLIYAGIHQTGGTIVPKNGDALAFALPNGEFVTVGKVTIPARPYLGVSPDDVTGMQELIEGHFDLAGAP